MSTTPSPRRSQDKLSLFAGLALAFGGLLAGCRSQADADFPETPASSFAPRRAEMLPPPGLRLAPAPEVVTSDVPLLASAPSAQPVRMWTDWDGEPLPGVDRSRRAREARLPVVTELFTKAGVTFPPAQMAFVAYKAEKQLEVWASVEEGGHAVKVATYGICAASGDLGPKRREGDRQVPEGFYAIQYGWAESAFHLEMKVSYPNMVDRVLGPRNVSLGGDIMIHGACASVGCMAMGDERAEELWVMMKAMGDAQVKVHIYPSRDMDGLLADAQYKEHHAFWQNLKEGRDLFLREGRIMSVKADWRGVYMFE